MTVCLDSWAILRWLEGVEPAGGWVEAELPDRPVMSWINLGEVSYVVERLAGPSHASRVVRDLRGRLRLELPSAERVLGAASIKAKYALAYADAFAIATAIANGLPLATGDPQILEASGGWDLVDLRA